MKNFSYDTTEFKFDVGRVYEIHGNPYVFYGYLEKDVKNLIERHRTGITTGYSYVLTAKNDEYIYWMTGCVFYPVDLIQKSFDYMSALVLSSYDLKDVIRKEEKMRVNVKGSYLGSKMISVREVEDIWVQYLSGLNIPYKEKKAEIFQSYCLQDVKDFEQDNHFYISTHNIFYRCETKVYVLDRITSRTCKMTNYKKLMFYAVNRIKPENLYSYRMINENDGISELRMLV